MISLLCYKNALSNCLEVHVLSEAFQTFKIRLSAPVSNQLNAIEAQCPKIR